MARLHIAVLFAVGILIALCDAVPSAEPTIEMKKLRDGRLCAKTDASQWYCIKE